MGFAAKNTIHHQAKMDHTSLVLKSFVRRCKRRLYSIQNEAYVNSSCGKLVTAIKCGKLQTWRCYGDTSGGGCYNCDRTSFSCHCGNNLKTGSTFCSSSCHGAYYNY